MANDEWDNACTEEDERTIQANMQRWRREYEEDPNKLLGQGELARKAKLFMDQKTRQKARPLEGKGLIPLDDGALDHVTRALDLEPFTRRQTERTTDDITPAPGATWTPAHTAAANGHRGRGRGVESRIRTGNEVF